MTSIGVEGREYTEDELKRIPRDENSMASRLLWDIVFLDFMEKTGPAKKTIDQVISLGHLSHQVEGEYQDDARLKIQEYDGTVKEKKRVISQLRRHEKPMVDGKRPGGDAVLSAEEIAEIYQSQPPISESEMDADSIMRFIAREYPPEVVKILEMWQHGHTQQEIAAALGINQSTVSRYFKNTLEELKKKFATD